MFMRPRVGKLGVLQSGALGAKVLSSVALLGAAAGVAGIGTFATFTSSTPAQSQSVTSGTVQLQLGAAGTSANRLSVGASDVAPGDTIQRALDLSSTGSSLDLGSISLTTTASPSSLLDTDATNGLQLAIDSCSLPWVETGPPYAYTCAGTTSTVVASRPVIGTNVALPGLASLSHGGTDHLRVTLTLPSSADNSFQGLSSTIGFVFTGTQRSAASK